MKLYQSKDFTKPIREIMITNDDPSASILVRFEDDLEIVANNEIKSYIDHMIAINMIDKDLVRELKRDCAHLFRA